MEIWTDSAKKFFASPGHTFAKLLSLPLASKFLLFPLLSSIVKPHQPSWKFEIWSLYRFVRMYTIGQYVRSSETFSAEKTLRLGSPMGPLLPCIITYTNVRYPAPVLVFKRRLFSIELIHESRDCNDLIKDFDEPRSIENCTRKCTQFYTPTWLVRLLMTSYCNRILIGIKKIKKVNRQTIERGLNERDERDKRMSG